MTDIINKNINFFLIKKLAWCFYVTKPLRNVTPSPRANHFKTHYVHVSANPSLIAHPPNEPMVKGLLLAGESGDGFISNSFTHFFYASN